MNNNYYENPFTNPSLLSPYGAVICIYMYIIYIYIYTSPGPVALGVLLLLGTPPAGLTKVSGLTQRANKHVNDEIGVHGLVQAVP